MMRLIGALFAMLAVPAGVHSAGISQHRMPKGETKKVFTEADMAKLKFLEGRWSGKTPDDTKFYEEYDFTDPSTLRSRRFPDANFTASTDGSTVALKNGALISTWGEFTWQAETLEDGHVTFRPVNAPSSFSWRRVSLKVVEVAQNWTDEKGAAQRHTLILNRLP